MDENVITVRPCAEPRDPTTLVAAVADGADATEYALGAEVFDGERAWRRVGVDEPEWSEITVDMPGSFEIVGTGPAFGPEGRSWKGYVDPVRALNTAVGLAKDAGAQLVVELGEGS